LARSSSIQKRNTISEQQHLIITKKPITASREELGKNPRAPLFFGQP
jgi:16S rRNA C1402 N4-methylase RsmH